MKFIKDILKGMVMGIANIIPGVSGGTMAVSMGIYDVLIHSVTHIFKEFKKSFNALLPIGIGMVVGILGLSRLIEWMFDAVPIQTNLLFIGLIIGGLPAVWNRVKGQTVRVWHIVGALAFFALVVGLAVLDGTEGSAADLTFSLMNCVKLFVVGVIAAATMVIPGVSGSMMLMLMGYYNPILETINGFIDDLIALNWDGIWAGVGVLAPCGIGILVGILGIAKLIEILLVKAPYLVFWCIIGLIVASPIAIVMLNDFSGINAVSIITGIVALAVGFVVAMKLGGDEKEGKAAETEVKTEG
ncbi:MAG: DUF368 domain-containing protein [Lachnospiraceae bacterium]|nr:DUF368 domain-containing protein [Lachnospiraceae bacterium]